MFQLNRYTVLHISKYNYHVYTYYAQTNRKHPIQFLPQPAGPTKPIIWNKECISLFN